MPIFSRYLPRLSSRTLTLAVALPLVALIVVGVLCVSSHQVDALVSGGNIGLNGCVVEVTLNGEGTASTGRYGTITFSSVFSNELVTCADSSASYFSALCTTAGGSHTFQYTHTGGPTSVDVGFLNGPTSSNIWLSCGGGSTCMTQAVNLPDCTGSTPPSGGGSTTSAPVLPPLDPPGTAPRVYGGYDNPGSEVVVYQQSFGYQFYSYTGVPVGQVTLSAVGIPGAGGLITSMSNENYRADLFYDGGDYLRVKFYVDGQLVEDGRFESPGIGARAGEVASNAGYGNGGSGATTAPGGTLQVLCPQRLRLEATTNSVIVDVLQRGDILAVIGRSNDNTWFNVTTADNLTGWVYYGQCINVNSSSVNNAPIEVEFAGRPTIGEQQAAPSAGQGGIVTVNAPPGTPVVGFSCGQNLRSGPGNDYFVIRVIPAGSSMIVTGRSDDMTWVQFSAGTLNGWSTLGGCASPTQGDATAAPVLVNLN